MQVVNALLSECQDARALVIRNRDPFLRAGAPRDTARNSDFSTSNNVWKCPYCKRTESNWSANHLTSHLRAQNYSSGYPNVLQCPGCASTFSKLSTLCEHLESKSCEANMDSGPPAALVKYLKTEVSKPDTKARLSELIYGLRTIPSKPGALYVKVTHNIKSSSERVAPV